MQGIGTLVTIACKKPPMHFQIPVQCAGTSYVRSLKKLGKIKTMCHSVSPTQGEHVCRHVSHMPFEGLAWQPWAAYSICSRSASRPTLPRL